MARTPKQVEFDPELCEQIVSLRDDEGYKWDQVAEAVEVPVGKTMLIYSWAKLPKKQRIKDATAEDIVRLRDEENLSWGDIIVRVNYPESSVRSMYEEATNKSTKGLRIGKGGRYPGDANPNADGDEKPKATKKAAAKKTAAKKVAPSAGGDSVLEGLSNDDVKSKLTGYAIKVHTGEGDETIKVKTVKKTTAKTVVIADESGASRTLKRDAVFAVSKKPVL